MSADLHARRTAAVEARLARAVAAQQPSDALPMSVWEDGFTKVRQGLEAEIERYCRRDLKVLERHDLCEDYEPDDEMYCAGCRGYDPPWPCIEIFDLAEAYVITTPAEQVDTEEAPKC